jgi:ATP-dependent Clp protease ATP-binding subunit ClpC
MGARPLRRVIQQKVEDPLSDALLSGDFSDGDVIIVDMHEGEIVLRHSEGQSTSSPEEAVATT